VFEASTGVTVLTLADHDNWVRQVMFHPDGRHLISISDDRSIKIWSLKGATCRVMPNPQIYLHCFFHPLIVQINDALERLPMRMMVSYKRWILMPETRIWLLVESTTRCYFGVAGTLHYLVCSSGQSSLGIYLHVIVFNKIL
jgi:WD40 repeat protein